MACRPGAVPLPRLQWACWTVDGASIPQTPTHQPTTCQSPQTRGLGVGCASWAYGVLHTGPTRFRVPAMSPTPHGNRQDCLLQHHRLNKPRPMQQSRRNPPIFHGKTTRRIPQAQHRCSRRENTTWLDTWTPAPRWVTVQRLRHTTFTSRIDGAPRHACVCITRPRQTMRWLPEPQ